MKIQRKWLLVVVLIVAAVAALALGLPASPLLLIGVSLLCPAAMFLGMKGMQHDCAHTGNCGPDSKLEDKTDLTKAA
jgi:fatty acid desaturase